MIAAAIPRAAGIVAAFGLALLVAGAALASSTQPRHPTTSLNSLEQGVLTDINAFRAKHKLAQLRLSSSLTTAARAHSEQMARQGYFAHRSPDGSGFSKRIGAFYRPGPSGYSSVGENMLWGSPNIGPETALELWLASPEHRANLMKSRWREIGISAVHTHAARGAYHDLEVTILTTDFGVRR
jgi:uncharacterized protein YkwD